MCRITVRLWIFQSTFPRGERRMFRFPMIQDRKFQSTFPRGERRRCWICQYSGCIYFNPRSLVGNDTRVESISLQGTGFQSTFPRGERHLSDIRICLFYQFQSTFPRGERLLGFTLWKLLTSYFNPRSLVGNDMVHWHVCPVTINFNPRSLVGNDDVLLRKRSQKPNFNPRSLVGNDCKFSQIFFVFLCNKYNFSTFYYPFSLFFSVIHVTFLIFVVRILPAFYVYF